MTGGKHIDLVVVGPLLEASPKKVIGKIITSYAHLIYIIIIIICSETSPKSYVS